MLETPITWYDTETTGINPRYDQPIQIAGLRTDCELRILEEFEIRCRPQPGVLAAPGALIVHGIGIGEILAYPSSFYGAMRTLEHSIKGWGPSAFAAYNGLRFDEEVLRHSRYRTLHQPYVTQLSGNTRFDALRLMQAAHLLRPGTIKVPETAEGKLTFKLDALASANGFLGHAAHDALGDTRAMIYLAGLIKQQAPDIWKSVNVWASKANLERLCHQQHPYLLLAEWRARANYYPLAPIAPNPEMPNEWLMVDLRHDPQLLLRMTEEELCAVLKGRKADKPLKLVKLVKLNAMPLLLSANDKLSRGLCEDKELYEGRVRALRSDRGFEQRAATALVLGRPSYPSSPYVEEQLYASFFPMNEEKGVVDLFHRLPGAEKFSVLATLRDARARTLGERLMFEEWPEHLPDSVRSKCATEIEGRLAANDGVPWTTIAKALEEITRLRPHHEGKKLHILDEYADYLHSIATSRDEAA